MLFQIFGMKEINEEERLAAMRAFMSIHCIQDQAMGIYSDRLVPQNNLILFINQAFVTLPVEQCLIQVAFILPKVREVRMQGQGSPEQVMSIKNIVDLSLNLVNQAYKLSALADRFYVLLVALRKFVWCSLNQALDGSPPNIFDIYSLAWFVALWNDQPVEVIPAQYKEELCMTLIEATLQVREDILFSQSNGAVDKTLLSLQLQHWVSVTLEVAEIVCKCLDWKSPNLRRKQKRGASAASNQSDFGITVSKSFLLLIEEVSYQIELLGNEISKKTKTRVQAQMFEVFKRVVTDKEEDDAGESQHDSAENEIQDKKGKREDEEFLKNYESPQIKAASILIFAKHWKPFDSSNKKNINTEEDGVNKIQQLVNYIFKMLDKVSQSKSSTIDAKNQGTWTHLSSLYYLGTRFQGIFQEHIKKKLKEVKAQFEKISRKIVMENEVRVVQGILDLIRVVMRFQSSQEDDTFITENENSIVCGQE